MPKNCLFIERVDAKAEVIEVVALRAGSGPASLPERAIERNQIDQSAAGAQLGQAEGGLLALDGAAKHVNVEAHEAGDIGGAQHQMVDTADLQHGGLR